MPLVLTPSFKNDGEPIVKKLKTGGALITQYPRLKGFPDEIFVDPSLLEQKDADIIELAMKADGAPFSRDLLNLVEWLNPPQSKAPLNPKSTTKDQENDIIERAMSVDTRNRPLALLTIAKEEAKWIREMNEEVIAEENKEAVSFIDVIEKSMSTVAKNGKAKKR